MAILCKLFLDKVVSEVYYHVNCALYMYSSHDIIIYNNCGCVCCHLWFSSGRGPEPDDGDIADPFNGKRFTVCMFLPMEIVTFSERVRVVEVGNLVEIPSEIHVHHAISKLYKNKEEHPDKFAYVKFPFGMIDYDGLHMLKT